MYSVQAAQSNNCTTSAKGIGHWPAKCGCLVQAFWIEVTYKSHKEEIYGKQVQHIRNGYGTFETGHVQEAENTEGLTGYCYRKEM